MIIYYFKKIYSYLSLTIYFLRVSLENSMQYRLSFFSQSLGMFLNDFFFIFLWKLYFSRFPSVNGWTFYETAIVMAVACLSIGLVMFVGKGMLELAKVVNAGGLDVYLTYPKNPLWHISFTRIDVAALGDILFGIAVYFIFCSPDFLKTVIFFTVAILAALIIYSAMLIAQSSCFWFGNSESSAMLYFVSIVTVSWYPQSIFSGFTKFLLMFVVPCYFVAQVPVELVVLFTWPKFLMLFAVTILFFCTAVWVFNRGLKRYESGNLIGIRI